MKELQIFIDKGLSKIGKAAYEAITEVINEESNKFYEEVKKSIPVKTGGLKNSFTFEKVDKKKKYGYKFDFKGTNSRGVRYAMIANILDKGTSKIRARRFVTKAERKLKGLDDRINKRFLEKLDQIRK